MDVYTAIVASAVLLVLFLASPAWCGRRYCRAVKNRVYVEVSQGRGRCQTCPMCDYGKGRDFSMQVEIRNGTYGDLECYPCVECPEGYFNNKRRVSCQPCSDGKCSGLHRHVQLSCGGPRDYVCGSCLQGFVDIMRNHDYPCRNETLVHGHRTDSSPSNKPSLTTASKTSAQTTQHLPEVTMQPREEVTIFQPEHKASGSQSKYEITSGTIALICVIVVPVLGLIVWLVHSLWRKRRERALASTASSQEKMLKKGKEKEAWDLEMDGADDEMDSGDGEDCRGERTATTFLFVKPEPRPELPLSPGVFLNGRGMTGMIPNSSCTTGRVDQRGRAAINLEKSDRYITFTATHLTCNLLDFFKQLGFPDNSWYAPYERYNEEKQSHIYRQSIFEVLNRWVEVREQPVTVGDLCNALYNVGQIEIFKELSKMSSSDRYGE